MATAEKTLAQIKAWCNGEWSQQPHSELTIETLATDTREIEVGLHCLFIPLVTKLRDGHKFIAEAYSKGVRLFLVSDAVAVTDFPEAGFLKVKDTLDALQRIAAGHRKQMAAKVVGITGSNGKTIVKEWLSEIVAGEKRVVKSPKSFNSQIGVPRSVWEMSAEHEVGIFEAGISTVGEMERLEKVIQPNIGIFCNIGLAHAEGFVNERQKINEKLFLFRHCKHLVYCRDHEQLNEAVLSYTKLINQGRSEDALQLFSWSVRPGADVRVVKTAQAYNSTEIELSLQGRTVQFKIPFIDAASVENAIHCFCTAVLLGISDAAIIDRMAQLQPVSMRMELRQGNNNCTIINDAYNSDLTSLQMALSYLTRQKQHALHTVILSDMLQMGKSDLELYEEVAELIARKNVHRFIGIGPSLHKNKAAFRKHKKLRSIFFKTTADFLKQFHLLTFSNEAILLKGARVFTFEKIALLLEQHIHQTVLNINLNSIRNNLDVFRSLLKPEVKMMAMVKAFSYGSGSHEIADLLQHHGVDYLTVAYTDEGIALRKAGVTLPIMVMSPELTSFDRMIAWKMEPEIFNFRSLQAFLKMADTLQVINYPVHIKLDTGMHRLGFEPHDLPALAQVLLQHKTVKVVSIFSHLAASDDPAQDEFTRLQGERFSTMAGELSQLLGYKPWWHICNSSGIARFPELHFDVVRLGIGLYGIDGTGVLGSRLQHISTLKTLVAQIRHIPKGETVGYGHKNPLSHHATIATVCIGYADGYPRSMGHGAAYMLVKGAKAPTVGSICMDMCMIDITGIPDVQEGDEVIVFGPELTSGQLADWSGTIAYEVLTGVSQRVKRVYTNE